MGTLQLRGGGVFLQPCHAAFWVLPVGLLQGHHACDGAVPGCVPSLMGGGVWVVRPSALLSASPSCLSCRVRLVGSLI